MSIYKKNRSLFLLLILMIFLLIVFLIINQQVKKGRAELFHNDINQSGSSYTCLNGTQSERSRICSELIREGTALANQLKNKCANDEKYYIAFLNQRYTCSELSEINREINNFLISLRK